MKELMYEVLQTGIANTQEVPIDRAVSYKCLICNSIVPSIPRDNTNCECGNIGIDKDMHRLWVGDYKKIAILKIVKRG